MNCKELFWFIIGTVLLVIALNIFSFGAGIFLAVQSFQFTFNPEQPTSISLENCSLSYLSMTASQNVIAIVGSAAPEVVFTNRIEKKEFEHVLEGDDLKSVHYAKNFHVVSSATAAFEIRQDALNTAVSVGAICWDIAGSVVYSYVRSVQGNASFVEQLDFPQNAITCELSADRAAAFGSFAFNASLKYKVPLFRFRPEHVVKTVDFQMVNGASLTAYHNHHVIIVPRSRRASVSLLGRYSYPKQFKFDLLEIMIVFFSVLIMVRTFSYSELFQKRVLSKFKKDNHKKHIALTGKEEPSVLCNTVTFVFAVFVSFIMGLVLLTLYADETSRYISVFPGQELVMDVEHEYSATRGILSKTQDSIAAFYQSAPVFDYPIVLQSNDPLSLNKFDYVYEEFNLGQLQKFSKLNIKTDFILPEKKIYLALFKKNFYAGIISVVELGAETDLITPSFGDYTLIVFTSDYLDSAVELDFKLIVKNAKVAPGTDVSYCDMSVEKCVFEPPYKYITFYGPKNPNGYSYINFSLNRFTALETAKLSLMVISGVSFIILAGFLFYRRNQK
ncbi:hypothetical protein MP638_000603 [Amoeboaphelidium occidentale]|nr:hypothetical protein MP638_000603 [Amoeboaphelidium occidentale]